MSNIYFYIVSFLPRRNLFIALCCLVLGTALQAQTKVVQTATGYTFMRNGQPYYVKGVGGEVNLDEAVAIGSNSIRTWGIDNAEQVLDEAHKRGLTVMLGFWLQHERHGFDYDDKDKVQKQLNHFKAAIDKYKNHPALLMWGIGNELDLFYTNPNCWKAVQDIAKYAHEVDPNHPTSTVTAGLDSNEVQHIKRMAPDVDVYCVNTYGDIANVPKNIERYGWAGPYMITEWGVNGYWESPKTSWNVSIEQTSTEKKQVFYERYKQYIEPNKDKCLGSYAFLWGGKQEYTETWFGLFSKENLATEPVDALEMVFKNGVIEKPAPTVIGMTIDSKDQKNLGPLKAEEIFRAEVVAKIGLDMTKTQDDTDGKFVYQWKILAESNDKKSGGDAEEEAKEILGLIKGGKKSRITFRAPRTEGGYRLFVKIFYNNKVAYANIPFWVDKRGENDKQARFVEFKKTDMESFNNDKE